MSLVHGLFGRCRAEGRPFEDVDFEELFGQHGEPEMTLVVPMVVVGELDGVASRDRKFDTCRIRN